MTGNTRGWTRDIDKRVDRIPQQRIEPDDWPTDKGGTVVAAPAWRWACQECGHEARIASESTWAMRYCEECCEPGELTEWEPLGELIYP